MKFAPSLRLVRACALCLLSTLGANHAWAASPEAAVDAKSASQDRPLVRVEGAWIRPTVKGQMATGGYMVLTSRTNLFLTGLSTPVAGSAEIHVMKMEGDVMRMRAVPNLMLPAGRTVSLMPGADQHHIMLMDLKRPLQEGEQVTLVLQLQLENGQKRTQTVTVPVRTGPEPIKRRRPQGPGPGFTPGGGPGAMVPGSGPHSGMGH